MSASHQAYRHARLERLLDHPNLLRRCPAPTALNRCDDLNSIRSVGHRHGCMPHTCQVGDRVRSVRGLSQDCIAGALVTNYVYGNAYQMSGSSDGGHNALTGGSGDNAGVINSGVINYLYGDAYQKFGSADGGGNTVTGGDSTGSGTVTNYLYGNAYQTIGVVKDGDDTIVAGHQDSGGNVLSFMWGDTPGIPAG